MGIDEESMLESNGQLFHPSFICGIVEGFYGRPWTNEQRKNLFERMKVMGLNTYLYGPKDDLKHRFEWRSLYNDEEVDLLRSLIQSAKVNNVNFVYSISPGIDISYSQPSEVKAIIRKLKQVEEIGCKHFALFFDDIEITMNEVDAKTFPSFVAAQIAVTNELVEEDKTARPLSTYGVTSASDSSQFDNLLDAPPRAYVLYIRKKVVYQLLGSVHSFMDADMFYFCPTEYCSTRSVPDVQSSDYLNTLGKNLNQGIEIMWTGPQVVSPELTPEHADEVAKVLKRKPLIWDNYHANDYDPKRIFLGPLKERPVALKKHISGLLLNPNCKFEANFLPFYTLSIWNECVENDVKSNKSDSNVVQVFVNKPPRIGYCPSAALDEALDKWLELYIQGPGPAIPPISQVECTITPLTPATPEAAVFVPPPTIRTCEGNDLLPSLSGCGSALPLYTSAVGTATTVTVQAYHIEAVLPCLEDKEIMGDETLMTANSLSTNYGETMTEPNQNSQTDIASTVVNVDNKNDNEMSMELVENESKITHEQLALLVDMFYLPFDYGEQALTMLEDFQFMHKNAHILRQNRKKDANKIVEWNCRFASFQSKAARLELFFRLFLDSPNRSLVGELFPHVAEAHATTTILSAMLTWMQMGNLVVLPDPIESWWKNRLLNVEPWTFGNGLFPDMHKLIISSPEVANLFLYKTPIPLLISSYRIEPIVEGDLDTQLLYNIFVYPEEKKFYEEISSRASASLFFDRCFGIHFKSGQPMHNFQVNEIDSSGEASLFAVITSIFSLHASMHFIKNEYVDEYREKYVEMLSDDKKSEELFLNDLNRWTIFQLPESFLLKYQSFIEIRWRNQIAEAAWVRRLFQCVAASLAMNGSNGLFTIIPDSNDEQINLLYRFGLSAINDVQIDGHLVLGHLLQSSA